MNNVFLEELPRKGGSFHKINWNKSVGFTVHFVYGDIEGDIKIIEYIPKGQKLIIIYDNKEFEMKASGLLYCELGRIVGKITKEFKIEISTNFKDGNRNITIIDREYRDNPHNKGKKLKYYKYHCNKCNHEDWKLESDYFSGYGCNACCNYNSRPVLGINTIWDTDRWMCDLGVSEEDAKTHTKCSGDKILVTCPDCGRMKIKRIADIYSKKSIRCECNDNGKSYPEKIMFSVLEQLKVAFETEYNAKWNGFGKRRYDFYFEYNNEQYIIETHGGQHYEEGFERIKSNKKARNLKEEQENDKLKKELALKNGIKEENYIVIDCRKSEWEYIKQNILKSKLTKMFDLLIIDWIKVEKFSLSNLVKITCEYKKNNPNITTIEIMKLMHMSRSPIVKYLNKGNKLGWCIYDGKEESRKSSRKSGKRNSKLIIILKNNLCLGIFESATELERQSEKLLGIKLHTGNICSVCNNKKSQYKGYIFKYIKDLTPEEYIKYDIENRLKESSNLNHIEQQLNLKIRGRYICKTTNKIFNTIREAGEYYDIKSTTGIGSCCLGKRNYCGQLSDGTKLQWGYCDEYLKQKELLISIHSENLVQAI